MTTHDPIAHLALAVGGILVAARAGGEVAKRAGMPQVLGEIVVGIGLRAIPGTEIFAELGRDPSLDVLARLGALLLLFDAGLALAVRDVLRAGAAAARVASLGTVASLALGLVAATLVLPGAPLSTRAFLAGALGATSVGVGARVLKDLGKTRAPEAKTILGAAVIDDVMGLIVLSLASGWAAGDGKALAGSGAASAFVALVVKTAVFFGVSLYAGAQGRAPRARPGSAPRDAQRARRDGPHLLLRIRLGRGRHRPRVHRRRLHGRPHPRGAPVEAVHRSRRARGSTRRSSPSARSWCPSSSCSWVCAPTCTLSPMAAPSLSPPPSRLLPSSASSRAQRGPRADRTGSPSPSG